MIKMAIVTGLIPKKNPKQGTVKKKRGKKMVNPKRVDKARRNKVGGGRRK